MAPIGHTAENINAALAELRANLSAAGAAGDLRPPNNAGTSTETTGTAISSKTGALSTAGKQPRLSEQEVIAFRKTWVDSGNSAEAFDAAMAADGISIPAPVDKKLQADHDKFNVPLNPVSTDYLPTFPRDFTPAIGTAAELGDLCASLQMDKHLGSGFASTLAEQALAFKGMAPNQQAAWMSSQQEIALRHVTADQFNAMRNEAANMLKQTGKNIAGALAHSPVMGSWFLVSTLCNHAKVLKAFNTRKR